ncbi:ABC transporter ATP-binding protein [Microbaculum marinisediminis]|uniref:ABC transporter ATP-binding protein n=1 Tax=Microbaculum marinisediminis TaxID=2931392 RepID=A0AAW5R1N9_9HYPH|nr:ABC transporter ATP-binding protein [Microbaculum sp. A6E488]MCT8973893.1 ABC transporter ATP-binding protein [Microbaculum sp. A6E488]
MAEYKLSLEGITKTFGQLKANDDVNLHIRPGSVHAILGENGAGKSTLMNVLFGLYKPDTGRILLDGKEVSFASPRHALEAGIGMVHQHFKLVGPLTVIENVVLGSRDDGAILNLAQASRKLVDLADRFGFEIDPDVPVSKLPVGMQQRVEILKLLYREVDVLILDEPTSVLTPSETRGLILQLDQIRKAGKTIIFITHKLDEVMEVSDRVTIMRHGRCVEEIDTAETDARSLATAMVGRQVVFQVSRTKHDIGDTVLSVDGLSARNERGLMALDGVSLEVRAGEVFGIAGVDGNGQAELAEVITGLRPKDAGDIHVDGRSIADASVAQRSREFGIAYVPEDRQRDGLVLSETIARNTILRRYNCAPFQHYGLMDRKAIGSHAARLVKAFDVRFQSLQQIVADLSGGNQQKIILAREIDTEPKLLIVAQPTKGLDVGAIEFVQKQILGQAERGAAVLYISTELEHLLHVCDRVGVMFRGRITGTLSAAEATPEKIGLLMGGVAEVA